jgi:VanZ family protein
VKALRTHSTHPLLWLAVFGAWAGILWWLSSQVRQFPPGMEFRFGDKVLHFTYFLGGGLSAAAFFYRLDPASPRWSRILLLATLAAGLTGVLDEWHQSWVPGRSGNDPADLGADLLGAAGGALLLRACRRVIS